MPSHSIYILAISVELFSYDEKLRRNFQIVALRVFPGTELREHPARVEVVQQWRGVAAHSDHAVGPFTGRRTKIIDWRYLFYILLYSMQNFKLKALQYVFLLVFYGNKDADGRVYFHHCIQISDWITHLHLLLYVQTLKNKKENNKQKQTIIKNIPGQQYHCNKMATSGCPTVLQL